MRRQLTGLPLSEAVQHLKEAHLENPNAAVLIKRKVGPNREETYTSAAVEVAAWNVEEVLANDWIFEDHTPEENPTVIAAIGLPESRLIHRDEAMAAIAAAVGQFYYKNPDSHKIAIEAVKRLGFP